jgi:hypothetical protein
VRTGGETLYQQGSRHSTGTGERDGAHVSARQESSNLGCLLPRADERHKQRW